jgi:hypothetical protein
MLKVYDKPSLFETPEEGVSPAPEKRTVRGLPKGEFWATKDELEVMFAEEDEIRMGLFVDQVIKVRSLKGRREKLELLRKIHGDEMVEALKVLVTKRFKETSERSS